MNNFLELCEKRESCRNFSDMPLEHEKLVKIVEAARLTPSACNSQPWNLVVVETPELVAEVATAVQQMGANKYVANAKAFIVILEERATLMPSISPVIDSQYFAKHDLGSVATTICYAAADLGIGTCILGLFDREKLARDLDIPHHYRFDTVIAVGYPANDNVRSKQRKPIEEISRFI